MRMYRTASHPEFIAYEIEPALVVAGLTTEIAPAIAQMMDAFGYTVEQAINTVRLVGVPSLGVLTDWLDTT